MPKFKISSGEEPLQRGKELCTTIWRQKRTNLCRRWNALLCFAATGGILCFAEGETLCLEEFLCKRGTATVRKRDKGEDCAGTALSLSFAALSLSFAALFLSFAALFLPSPPLPPPSLFFIILSALYFQSCINKVLLLTASSVHLDSAFYSKWPLPCFTSVNIKCLHFAKMEFHNKKLQMIFFIGNFTIIYAEPVGDEDPYLYLKWKEYYNLMFYESISTSRNLSLFTLHHIFRS